MNFKSHLRDKNVKLALALAMFLALTGSLFLGVQDKNTANKAKAAEMSVDGKVYSPSYAATVTVTNPSQMSPISKNIWGLNYEGYNEYTDPQSVFNAMGGLPQLQGLGVKMIRFPGGWPALFYDYTTSRMKYHSNSYGDKDYQFLTVNQMISIANQMGGEVLWQMNYPPICASEGCVHGGSPRVYPTVDQARAFVQTYAPLGIKNYELVNEDSFFSGGIPDGPATSYVNRARDYAMAMKSVDPTIKISISGKVGWWDPPKTWVNDIKTGILSQMCGAVPCFDSVAEHPYIESMDNVRGTPAFDGRTAYFPQAKLINYWSRLKGDYFNSDPTRNLDLTEWNFSYCWESPVYGRTSEHGFYTFESIMSMILGKINMAQYHDMAANRSGCDIFTNGALTPAGQVFKLSSVLSNAGNMLNTTVSGAPTRSLYDASLPVLSAYSGYTTQGGSTFVFLDNRDTNAATVNVNLSAVPHVINGAATVNVSSLTASSWNGGRFQESTTTLPISNKTITGITIPARTIVRLQIPHDPAACFGFSDVPPTHSQYGYIMCVSCRGIVNGYTDGTFRPSNNVTRGQVSKMISIAANYTEAPPATPTFNDVPATQTFFPYVERVARHGIVSGYPCGSPGEPCPGTYFRQQNNVTRSQLAKMIVLAKAYPLLNPGTPTFLDVPRSHPFFQYVETAAAQGIISGYACGGAGEPCPGTYFRPQNNVIRAQAAKMIAIPFTAPSCYQLGPELKSDSSTNN